MATYKNLSLSAVEKLAASLADELKGRKVMIGLIGPLGAGKTTFIKSFAKQLGIKKISSPTFVIAHEYQTSSRKLFHLDFYRLTDIKQLLPLGLSEMNHGQNIILIEWADKFPSIISKCDLIIKLTPKPKNKRDVVIQAQ